MTEVDNSHALVHAIDKYLVIRQDAFTQEVDWVAFRETGRHTMRTKYKQNKINLFDPVKRRFPTGRLGYILQWCKENGVAYRCIDTRVKPKKQFECKYVGHPCDDSEGFAPRPYQAEAPAKVKDVGRGVLWHATASGKTVTGARTIQVLGVNTLYMVPSQDLLHQTAEDLAEVLQGVTIGKCGDGEWNPQQVTVATTATLWSRYEKQECKDLLDSTQLLIGDEAHHIQSSSTRDKNGNIKQVNSWYIIAINCEAYYRVGMTGTPGKDIEQKRSLLECAFGRVIDRVSSRMLIDLGVIADVDINMHKIKHSVTQSDYPTARKLGIIMNPEFNAYIVDIAIQELKAGKNVLLLTGSKQHQGPALVRAFKDRGFHDVPFVSSGTLGKARRKAREDFKAGKLKCLIGTVYKEGINFPLCDCGILCDGGKDEKKTIQFLGRILRKGKDAKTSTLHDFFHEDAKYLKKHSNNRLKTYMEEELDSIIMHTGITINYDEVSDGVT